MLVTRVTGGVPRSTTSKRAERRCEVHTTQCEGCLRNVKYFCRSVTGVGDEVQIAGDTFVARKGALIVFTYVIGLPGDADVAAETLGRKAVLALPSP